MTYERICAWCNKHMGHKEGAKAPGEKTHGICDACKLSLMNELNDDIPITCDKCGATVPLPQTDGYQCMDCLPFADDAPIYPQLHPDAQPPSLSPTMGRPGFSTSTEETP